MKTPKQTNKYSITIELRSGHTCYFEYTDLLVAKEQFTQYSVQGVVNGQVIKTIEKNW